VVETISVRSAGSVVELARDGETFLRVGSIRELIAAAKELEENDPLRLASGVHLEIDVPARDRAALFEALQPGEDADALGVLHSRWDEAVGEWFMPPPDALAPLDDGILVNDRPWGWCWVSPGLATPDRFYLVPLDNRDEVLSLELWQSGSMTGAVITVKLISCNEFAGMAWGGDDSDGLEWMAVSYDLENGGLAAACQRLLQGFSEQWMAVCPFDECDAENGYGLTAAGWVITVDASGRLDERTLASVIAALYEPCQDHVPRYAADGERVLSVAGHYWKWEHESWVKVK
jgi:hypothetical protein